MNASIYEDLDLLQMERTRALEYIMDSYGDEIKRFIYTYVKNNADTDDITQEVFVTVFQKLDTFQGKSTLKSWIYSIAANKCKDHLRSWTYRNRKLREKMIQSKELSEQKNTTPELFSIQQSDSNEMISQILKLPVHYREVIILFYFKEMSTKEIAEVLNIFEGTVRTRLNRAREKLKRMMEHLVSDHDKGGLDWRKS